MADDANRSGSTPARITPPAQRRADALSIGVRRSLWPVLAIALVIAVQAFLQFLTVAPEHAGMFVVYSLLMLGVLPVLVTFGASGMTALLTSEPLPAWLVAVFAGVITGAWVMWIAASGWVGLVIGVLLGGTVVGAALVLGRRWSLLVRLPSAVGIAVVGSVITMLAATAVA